MKIIEKRKAETTIRRPDGRIDIGIHPKIDYFTPGLFAQMQKAMMDAGRGEVLSYRNIEAVVEREESDYRTRCTRCGKALDTRTANHQREWTRFGGSKIQIDAFYCDGCFSLLRSIGAGERTELEERAGYVPSYEPTHKEDF